MKCLSLAKFRMNQWAIAAEIGCSQATVGRLIKRYRFETFIRRTLSPGPTFKTSVHDNRHLIITAKCNFERPLQDITNLSGLPISRFTRSHRLKDVNLQSRYAKQKPFLLAKHKCDRLEWALRYKDWTPEHWAKVIWSDEALSNVRRSSQTGESTGNRPAFSGLGSSPGYNSYKVTGSRITKVTLSIELI